MMIINSKISITNKKEKPKEPNKDDVEDKNNIIHDERQIDLETYLLSK